jgi:para-nitrobenzyl esterase
MAHPGLSAESAQRCSGNYGLLDMVAALRWVRRNIAAFGGDPDQVTLFGQSAGAAGIVDLTAAPRARGLFARAIAESFGVTPMRTLAEAERSGAALAERIGADGTSELRQLDAETLLARYQESGERWMPIVDGDFIARPVHATFAEGREAPVPFSPAGRAKERLSGGGHARRAGGCARAPAACRGGASSVLTTRPRAAEWRRRRRPVRRRRLPGHGAAASPTWVCHFDHPQPFPPSSAKPGRGSGRARRLHGAGTLRLRQHRRADARLSLADRRMTDLMQAYWLQFAKHGDERGPRAGRPSSTRAAPAVMRLAPGGLPTCRRSASPSLPPETTPGPTDP